MKFLKTIFIGFLIHSCMCEYRKCRNCAGRKAELPVEELRQLRYEYLKEQILKKLHLTVAPRTNLPKPPLKSLLVIAEMTENETTFETEDQQKTESVVIYPRNDNFICYENKRYPCSRFEFAVPESLTLENLLSAEVWFYNKPSKYNKVYIITTDQLQNSTSIFKLSNTAIENNIESWSKYNVPSSRIKSNSSSENIFVLEVTDQTNGRISNRSRGQIDEKPFLVIRSETPDAFSRNKRSTTCGESSTSCCKENFFLNFSEIGWDNWILHPDGYQANFCRGRCFNDLSNTRFYHSAVLLSYIRDNKDIAEEIGLNMCCTPSVMAPVTIIYRNEEGLIYHKSIDNMKVEACDCA